VSAVLLSALPLEVEGEISLFAQGSSPGSRGFGGLPSVGLHCGRPDKSEAWT
jgi:hypothetical protein